MEPQQARGGPDIDELLSFTNEELKGKLKPAEVIVDKETLIEASRAQNKALIFIHEKLQSLHRKLNAVEAKFTARVDEVEVQLGQWGNRVEILEKKAEVRLNYVDYTEQLPQLIFALFLPASRGVVCPTRVSKCRS